MGGSTPSTQEQGVTPFISAPSDPRDMPDPLIEGLKYAAGTMGYGPNAAAPSGAPKMQEPANPPPIAPQSPQMAQDGDYTIPPDPLIETLKWRVGSSATKNAPKRR